MFSLNALRHEVLAQAAALAALRARTRARYLIHTSLLTQTILIPHHLIPFLRGFYVRINYYFIFVFFYYILYRGYLSMNYFKKILLTIIECLSAVFKELYSDLLNLFLPD